MQMLLGAPVALAGLVATVAAILGMLLVLRNPHRPRWMQSEFAAQAASLVLVTATAGCVAYAMIVFQGLGHSLTIAAGTTFGVMFAAGYLLWRIFHIGLRLKRADAGHSPFEAIRHKAPRPPRAAQIH